MSILKILENSNVNLEEFEFLTELLKRNKQSSENAIKRFNAAEVMYEFLEEHTEGLSDDKTANELRDKAKNAVDKVKKELILIESLIKKLEI